MIKVLHVTKKVGTKSQGTPPSSLRRLLLCRDVRGERRQGLTSLYPRGKKDTWLKVAQVAKGLKWRWTNEAEVSFGVVQ